MVAHTSTLSGSCLLKMNIWGHIPILSSSNYAAQCLFYWKYLQNYNINTWLYQDRMTIYNVFLSIDIKWVQ